MNILMRRRVTRVLTQHARIARVLLAVGATALFAAACDVHHIYEPGAPNTLVITPNPQTLAVGATQQFTAIAKDYAGVVSPTPITWSVVGGGGSIDANGLFKAAGAPGTYANTIKATTGSVSATATVIVTVGPVVSITVTPNPTTLAVGATQQFVAVGKDVSGNVVTFTPTWTVVNGGGTVSSTGLFTAGTVIGTFTNTVQAAIGGTSATATVIVTAGPLAIITVTPNPVTLSPGFKQQFTAVGTDASGNVIAITPVWSVVNGGGSIDATSGLFTAAGSTATYANTVRATSGAISGSATVTIVAGALAGIIVTPNPVTLAPGATQQFTAIGTDVNGNAVPITAAWSVVSGGGTIDASTGVFTAGTLAGTFSNTVKATSGSVSGTATVIVTPGPLASITVLPNPVTLGPGNTQQFTAVGRDANGNGVAITPVWSVVAGGGTIDATSGLFTAGGTSGTFINTVRAAQGGISGSATVTVIVPALVLASITVTPNPASVPTNGTQQFTAVGRDAANNIVVINPVWSVVNGGGSITQNGIFTAGAVTGTFNNTVQATSGAISGTATVIVTAVAPPPLVILDGNGIIAGTAVTCVAGGLISADISISPGIALTGFPPCIATGAKNLGGPVADKAQVDLTTAYNILKGRPCPPANALGPVADIGGTTKAAGVYCGSTSIAITGVLTLDGGGDPNATFVFQAGSTLVTAGNIVLINGAQAKNVYFQVGTSATFGTASQIQGNILAQASIGLKDNATLLGRALARDGAVTLGSNNTITLP